VRNVQAARGKALTGPPAGDAGPSRPRRVGLLVGVAAAIYALDVISKAVVVATLSHHPPVRLLGGFLTLLVLRNSGAAFSVGTSLTVVFTLIAVGVIVFILRTSRRLRSLPWALTLGLLLGGATGNLTDRLLRAPGIFRGEVVDWIQIPHWPVFNVADSAIVCGGVLAVLLAARGIRLDGTRDGQARASERRDGTGQAGEGGHDDAGQDAGRGAAGQGGTGRPGAGHGAGTDTGGPAGTQEGQGPSLPGRPGFPAGGQARGGPPGPGSRPAGDGPA
jgi:signal peptidase II